MIIGCLNVARGFKLSVRFRGDDQDQWELIEVRLTGLFGLKLVAIFGIAKWWFADGEFELHQLRGAIFLSNFFQDIPKNRTKPGFRKALALNKFQ